MAVRNVQSTVLVLEYKGHKFYADLLDEEAPLIHFHNGREIKSYCSDEERAIEFVDQI